MPGCSPGSGTETGGSGGSVDDVWTFLLSLQTLTRWVVIPSHLRCSARVKVCLSLVLGLKPWCPGPKLTFDGLQMSHTCTGTPFFARLTRRVMGVNLTGTSDGLPPGRVGGLDPPPAPPLEPEICPPYGRFIMSSSASGLLGSLMVWAREVKATDGEDGDVLLDRLRSRGWLRLLPVDVVVVYGLSSWSLGLS